MKVLFIGGNGNISWWCVQKAIEKGHDVYELNRGLTRKTRRAVQSEVHEIIVDIRDKEATIKALGNMKFDVVCDFICFNEEQARQAIEIFKGRASRYIVISSEAIYKREKAILPFTEDSALYDSNIDDSYIRGKIQVETVFCEAIENKFMDVTIIRPGFTYDTILQVPVGQNCFTAPQRYLDGYPFLIPGEGENTWAPLHSEDFANAFVAIMENEEAKGDIIHIAGEELISLNEMARNILSALGLNVNNVIHIPYDKAIAITEFYGETITKQHMGDYLYDNSKLRHYVPEWHQEISFDEGINRTVEWLLEDKTRCRINERFDSALEEIYSEYM